MNQLPEQPHPERPASPRPGVRRGFSLFGLGLIAWDRVLGVLGPFWPTWKTKLTLLLLHCQYGRRLRVDGRLIIRAPRKGAIRLGDNVRLNSRFGSNLVGLTNATVLQCLGRGRIRIGNNSGCSAAILSSRASIDIGEHVKVGGNVRIFDHDYHALDYRARRVPAQDIDQSRSAPVVIGDDVLIGTNAVILKGVTIGAGSVIGAGAVVTLQNIPAGSLVAGNPARIIRTIRSTESSAPPATQEPC